MIIFSSISASAQEIPKIDSISTVDTESKMTKSTWGAIWRSMLIPGWGQLYVDSYWKAPIFFGAAGTLTYLIFYNNSNYIDYSDKLDLMDKADKDYAITKLWREYYRDNRDMSGFYLIAVYALAAVDAYVGAHLYDFDVGDDLSINLVIKNASLCPMIGISINY